MVNILTGTPFDAPKRLHHREDEGALEFPSSVSLRVRNLLALKAQNWRTIGGSEMRTIKCDAGCATVGEVNVWMYGAGLKYPCMLIRKQDGDLPDRHVVEIRIVGTGWNGGSIRNGRVFSTITMSAGGTTSAIIPPGCEFYLFEFNFV